MSLIPAQRGHRESVVVTGDALEIRRLRVTHREVVSRSVTNWPAIDRAVHRRCGERATAGASGGRERPEAH